jgi:hypothetical protein
MRGTAAGTCGLRDGNGTAVPLGLSELPVRAWCRIIRLPGPPPSLRLARRFDPIRRSGGVAQ